MSDKTLMMGSITLMGASMIPIGMEEAFTKAGDILQRSSSTHRKLAGGLLACAGALLVFTGGRYMWRQVQEWSSESNNVSETGAVSDVEGFMIEKNQLRSSE